MTAYLIIVVALMFLVHVENDTPGESFPGKLACIILIIFGGLRFETGFDWVEYEYYFELMRPFWSDRPEYLTSPLLIEPGFAFFNYIARSLGFSFQMLLFSITLINMVTIYFFARRYTARIALVFLVYYGFVFLAGQMAAIRQTLSYSFLLIAFMQRDKGKLWTSLVLIGIATSIHTFSIAFAPFVYFRIGRLPLPFVTMLVAFGLITAYSGFDVVQLAADSLLPILGVGFLATKLSLYGDYESANISITSLMFVPLHLAAYFMLTTRRFQKAEVPTDLAYFAASVTLLSLLTHSYFGGFPALWNRVSYLTFLLQPIALTARYRAYFAEPIVPLAINGLAGAAAATIIAYALSAPTSLPYLPYQNAVVAWATGNDGDGRWRYAYAFHQAEVEIANKRR